MNTLFRAPGVPRASETHAAQLSGAVLSISGPIRSSETPAPARPGSYATLSTRAPVGSFSTAASPASFSVGHPSTCTTYDGGPSENVSENAS